MYYGWRATERLTIGCRIIVWRAGTLWWYGIKGRQKSRMVISRWMILPAIQVTWLTLYQGLGRYVLLVLPCRLIWCIVPPINCSFILFHYCRQSGRYMSRWTTTIQFLLYLVGDLTQGFLAKNQDLPLFLVSGVIVPSRTRLSSIHCFPNGQPSPSPRSMSS